MPSVQMLLRDAAPASLKLLSASERTETFEAGQDLLRWGEMPPRLYEITAGRTKVWRPGADGHAVVLLFHRPGDTAGLMSVCRGRAAVANVTATVPVTTVSYPVSLIQQLLHDDPQLALNAIEIVGQRMELFADRMEDLSSGRADQQLARALLRLAGEDGEWLEHHTANIPVTRQDLADMTGSTLHTASRTLSGWEARRLVRSKRGSVTITDPAGLAAIAGIAG